MSLAEVAYSRFAEQVAGLDDSQWALPTDCAAWTVRDMAGHVAGAMRSASSLRATAAEQREIKRRAKADGGNVVDHMTALQVENTASLTTEELTAELRALVPRAVAGRRRVPAPMRRFMTAAVEMGPISERWRIGYLIDVILTRDAWLHRIDLCRAIGAEPELTAEHDGRIIADVVAEWARRHGQSFWLSLTGPAGGEFTSATPVPSDAERIQIDAVEMCRVVSGRPPASGTPPTGLLSTFVPF